MKPLIQITANNKIKVYTKNEFHTVKHKQFSGIIFFFSTHTTKQIQKCISCFDNLREKPLQKNKAIINFKQNSKWI